MRIDDISLCPDGKVTVTTPPDPRTGQTQLLLDPLELIHALTTQIPEPGQHLLRYLGLAAYSNRAHSAPRPPSPDLVPEPATEPPHESDPPPWLRARRASWARLLRRIFEVDPLLCPCGGTLRIVSVITDSETVDRILSHIRNLDTRAFDPFEAKAPRAPPPVPRPC